MMVTANKGRPRASRELSVRRSFLPGPSLRAIEREGSMTQGVEQRMLLTVDEVMNLLQLEKPQVKWLANTAQIQPIQICGQERFDVRDVRRLVDSYKITQARRKH
jgi:hypothetical protein